MPTVVCALHCMPYDCNEFVCIYANECTLECNRSCEHYENCGACNFNESDVE